MDVNKTMREIFFIITIFAPLVASYYIGKNSDNSVTNDKIIHMLRKCDIKQ